MVSRVFCVNLTAPLFHVARVAGRGHQGLFYDSRAVGTQLVGLDNAAPPQGCFQEWAWPALRVDLLAFPEEPLLDCSPKAKEERERRRLQRATPA